jgi:hypothetical protein
MTMGDEADGSALTAAEEERLQVADAAVGRGAESP